VFARMLGDFGQHFFEFDNRLLKLKRGNCFHGNQARSMWSREG
jgi:hypothetical protein